MASTDLLGRASQRRAARHRGIRAWWAPAVAVAVAGALVAASCPAGATRASAAPAGSAPVPRVVCSAIHGRNSGWYEDNPTYTDPVDDSATWRFSTPAAEHLRAAPLQRAASELAGQSELHSFIVLRNNAIVFERYFNGSRRQDSNNIHSASKSMLSAAVGIAIEKGLISSPDQRLATLLRDEFASLGSAERTMTVRHLLTMTSGLRWVEDSTETSIETTSNWVQAILDLGLDHQPGTTFNYSTGSAHLLSATLTKAAGMSTCDFVERNLFAPLGITPEHWGADPQGIFSGGYNLYLTAREMAKFGLLYLDEGRWHGAQVVPRSWVVDAMRRHVDTGGGYGYGYNWWIHDVAGHEVAIAWGWGGQLIYIIKDLNLVVVMTTDTHSSSIDFNGESILARDVIPAVR